MIAPSATQQDQAFLYDQLQQIVNRQRGVLNINHTAAGGIPAETEAWDHDEQGNWRTYDTTEDGQPAIEQTRGHNQSNQVTKIDGSSANVAHDANGNMALVPTSAPTGPQGNLDGPPLKTTWDAWNRTRLVHDQNDVLIQDNRYDGLTRRTQEITSAGARHFYYNDQWRSVEERVDTATTPERQHIWHPADRWNLIRRDRDTNANGTLDEHVWCLKDDLDPVAIADPTGAIIERLSYTAFGITTFLTPAFEPRPGNQSNFTWNVLFHVEFTDESTGWMNYGYRYYVPVLGRWARRDPAARVIDPNLYRLTSNSSVSRRDVIGLVDGSDLKPFPYDPAEEDVKESEAQPDRNDLPHLSDSPDGPVVFDSWVKWSNPPLIDRCYAWCRVVEWGLGSTVPVLSGSYDGCKSQFVRAALPAALPPPHGGRHRNRGLQIFAQFYDEIMERAGVSPAACPYIDRSIRAELAAKAYRKPDAGCGNGFRAVMRLAVRATILSVSCRDSEGSVKWSQENVGPIDLFRDHPGACI